MRDQDALLASIREFPFDDLPRLVYADWLEENGQPERAEFIRVQLDLARDAGGPERRADLRRREIELILEHKEGWFGAHREHWRYYEVRRGFVNEIWAPAWSVLPHLDWLHANHALAQLRLSATLDEVAAVLAHPVVRDLRCLDLGTAPYGPTVDSLPTPAAAAAACPLDLTLTNRGEDVRLVRLLTGSPHLGRLSGLDLSRNRLGLVGLTLLLDHLPKWPRLTSLNLSGGYSDPASGPTWTNVGDAGIVQLARHPAAGQLRVLHLSGNHLDDSGTQALVQSAHLDGLTRLGITGFHELPLRQRILLHQRFGGRIEGNG